MKQRRDFLRIARAIGVRVESPFLVQSTAGAVRFDAYLPDFGGTNGMVVMLDGFSSFNAMVTVTDAAGLYFSALNGNAETSEEDVKATLNDWGYYGSESSRPAWFTGKPWT